MAALRLRTGIVPIRSRTPKGAVCEFGRCPLCAKSRHSGLLDILCLGRCSRWSITVELPRRRFLPLAASIAALPASLGVALALDYPARPVRLIVGFPAGGLTDILARLLSPWLSERLGQQFIVEDQPGAGTNLATETVVKARPDGYTFLMATSTNAINATLYDNLKFNFVRDTTPVARACLQLGGLRTRTDQNQTLNAVL